MHDNLFEKISKNPRSLRESVVDSQIDAKALETIKLLGKQIIEIREVIDEQAQTINSLKKEVQILRNRQSETEANFNLSHIDQKDLAKQLRMLKAAVQGSQIASQRQQASPQVVTTSQASSQKTQELKIEEYYPNIQNSQVLQNSQTLEMISNAMPQGQISEENITDKKVEDIASQFIFGRMPKLLKLD